MAQKKPRAPWWGYVKSIISEYPRIKKEIETPLEPTITANISEIGGGSGVSSPVERAVIHDVSPQKQKKYDAVETAIQKTKQLCKDYEDRLTVIELVYWQKTHKIPGAAMQIYVHPNTAGRFSSEFIRLVAEELELP